MNSLEKKLESLDSGLYSRFQETKEEVELLLSKYDSNFPTYTDHSIKHTSEVFKLISNLLNQDEINNLNSDEIYILSMASILHDIGMCLPESEIIRIYNEKLNRSESELVEIDDENLIRNIHHELSYEFILNEIELLKIPSVKYAEAIGLVAKGHRKVALDDIDVYQPKFFVKSGRDFVCLPYLASILRLGDELDITNIRTPKLLTKYYMPNNEISIREWKKHISTTQINFTEDQIIFEVTCTEQNNLAALEEQFEKIQNQSNYCQKIIRTISNTEDRRFKLNAVNIVPNYKFIGFDPKGIKFSFDVNNVVKTFIGEDLYEDNLVSIREAIQNSIDSCRYKRSIYVNDYTPEIRVTINEDSVQISDDGLGMDEFVIEHFFGKLGSSFYDQEKVSKEFEAIGQFGVGVFSYFLLGEYIDIETKTENGNALKFRIDKDPKNYFHFFDEGKRKSSGTTMTLFLKDEIIEKYKFNDYYNYIRSIFKHIEFPIIVIENDKEYKILNSAFDLDSTEEIRTHINLKNKNIANKFTLIKHSIANDDYEGECALIVNKISKNNIPQNTQKYFDYNSFHSVDHMHDKSRVSISQKGVFVNNYSSNYLTLMIGDINFKKGRKIKINRKEFVHHESVAEITDIFAVELIKKYFVEVKQKIGLDDLPKVSDDFLDNYLRSYFFKNTNIKLLKSAIEENILVKFFNKKKESFTTFKDIDNTCKEFILANNVEDKELLKKDTELPILFATESSSVSTFNSIYNIFIKVFNYTPKVFVFDNRAHQVLYKGDYSKYKELNKIYREFLLFRMKDIQYIDSKFVIVTISKNKKRLPGDRRYYSDNILNANHPYFKFILKNYSSIKKNKEFEKIIKTSFEMMLDIVDDKRIVIKKINELNEIIMPLLEIDEIWSFTKADFQGTDK